MTPDKELEYAAESAYKKITGDGSTPISTELFKAGVQWQLNRVLEILRKQSFRNNLTCHQWASWLESKLTPGQKEE